MTQARCPDPGCAAVFQVEEERLGRNMRCPACGIGLTARPLAVTQRLRQQEALATPGDGAAIPRLPMAVLVDNVRSLWNVGSIFRTADACGVQQVVLAGITGHPPRAEISKTALGAEEAVAWRYHAEPLEALRSLEAEGFVPLALEATGEAMALDRIHWPSPLALVVGNEVAGISPAVLDACRQHVAIPMRGVKNSLNVAVAFGIAAHHAALTLARQEVT